MNKKTPKTVKTNPQIHSLKSFFFSFKNIEKFPKKAKNA